MSALPAENVRQIEPQALVTMTPMDMLARAVQSGADLDMIEKLMNLQERWEASNARKAFDEAVAAAKADIPVILKNASSHNSGLWRISFSNSFMDSRSFCLPAPPRRRARAIAAAQASMRSMPIVTIIDTAQALRLQ